jgi:arylsulfatase A-like enzyme
MKKIIYLLVVFTTIIFSGCTEKKTPPNIIFLLTDDQRWDAMGCADNPYIQTPAMDKLAEGGVMFKKAYVTTPICAISRASILSGQYAYRHGIEDFSTSFTDSAYQYTYPILLKKAGYKIGFIGKYGVGKGKDFPVKEYDYWRCFPGQGYYWHKDSLGRDVHLTRIIGDQTLEFLEHYSNQGQN